MWGGWSRVMIKWGQLDTNERLPIGVEEKLCIKNICSSGGRNVL